MDVQVTITFEVKDLDDGEAVTNAVLDCVQRQVPDAIVTLTPLPYDADASFLINQWEANTPHLVYLPEERIEEQS